jgi:hypothetical protein
VFTAYIASATIVPVPLLTRPASIPYSTDDPMFSVPPVVYPASTAKNGDSPLAGEFQLIPILLQYIGDVASAHVIHHSKRGA